MVVGVDALGVVCAPWHALFRGFQVLPLARSVVAEPATAPAMLDAAEFAAIHVGDTDVRADQVEQLAARHQSNTACGAG